MKTQTKLFTALLALALVVPAMQSIAGPGGGKERGGALCAPLTQFDTNTDGAVSVEEFAAAKAAEVAVPQKAFLAKFDTDANGTVTSEEALGVFVEQAAGWLEGLLEHYDKNDDCAISSTDFTRKPRGFAALIETYDTDGNGAVTAAEIVALQPAAGTPRGGRR